ncbi:UDP-glucose dehydrogenase [Desulfocucumis palustris]|uniref:UDP-glucose dehydrogenase n=1 Tax=Desulfocucumis palustris TaxID=1898651 RepID=A0A2L2XDF7_9FIRM|nr:nucleotide sugar dehydrogenase [Desulfocucumis palustris]GBF34172.1 UDP-glucose dehydrogenase [Desulfocucumis palustris]
MTPDKERLMFKIVNKTAYIGILGLGYVGLPLGLAFVKAGFKVLGFDIDVNKVKKLNQGKNYLKHIGTQRVVEAKETGRFEATIDYSRVVNVDVLILCVPTPLNRYREPDMSYVFGTVDALLPHLRPGQLISLESTTYPGTTEEEIKPRIRSRGFKVGEDIFLVYSPEREDPGNKNFTTATIPKVVGGSTPACLKIGQALYGSLVDKVVTVSSTKAAELTKLLENIYRSVNIGLVNEMKIVADRMGIDIWEVIEAASTKPFGFTPFYPGPGWGGHCIPIDPFYLTWKAREYGVQTKFIELAGEVNTAMPEWVVGKIIDALNENEKSLKGSSILVMGISYKKNIDDMRESPAVKIMEILSARGAIIKYCDPYVPVFPKMRRHYFPLKSMELSKEVLQQADCVLIATDHDCFDYDYIYNNARLIIDTRGRYRGRPEKVVSC